MKALNQTKNNVIAHSVELADTPWTRMKGLLGRTGLASDQALLITHCNSIHMFFMKFPIDVVFIDRKGLVVGLVRNIPPFHVSPIFWKSASAIELPSGTLQETRTEPGDQIVFQ